jgi:putative colanic acid biosynthesis acetyltransferase WcaF
MTSNGPMRKRSLGSFRGERYDKGRSVLWQALWFLVMNTVFMRWWCPLAIRVHILRAFGAQIGKSVVIRHRVRIHWPWKLTVGDNTWIGEGVWLLNLEPIAVGSDVCISQEVFLCTGSHDLESPTFEYDNGAITIHHEVWLCAQVLVLRGVTVDSQAVIGARAIVTKDVFQGTFAKAGSVL